MNFRALSDKWQFRRKQKKWLRRKDSTGTTPQEDSLFSSTEDILDTSHAPDDSSPPRSESPLMMVSELRKSLTGLDRTVKTYSFMVGEDQMPVIQVEPPPLPTTTTESLVQMSSAYSSFDSDEDDNWESNPYPYGGMDNFATGMMDTFESNLLKLKDFQTQSLPDVFEATKHFADDVSDISPLSSASASTVSILDSASTLDPPLDYTGSGSRAVNQSSMSPLALNGHISPPTREDHHHSTQFGIGEADNTYSSSPEKKSTPQDEVSNRYDRVGSAASCRTWESNSPVGSESSERDLSAPSPQPMVLERLKFSLPNGGIGGNVANGLDSPGLGHQRQFSSEDGANKRGSKISISSYKHGEDTGSLKYV